MTRTSLKTLLAPSELLIVPGVYDALGALLVERAGFACMYLSGASIAYTRLGRPDVGLVSLNELADTALRLRERSDIGLIVDADTGFGNALNVQRTVRLLERSGADCIQLEDQQMPKRCGHLRGKTVVSTAEMAGKIRAAVDARQQASTLIMARTDAIAVEGFDAALARAEHYLEAGADVLFIEAPESVEQMRAVCARFASRIPLLANMVEGGRTPVNDVGLVRELGYSIAIFPGAMVRVITHAVDQYLEALSRDGDTRACRDRMLEFHDLQAIVGTDEMLAHADRYDS